MSQFDFDVITGPSLQRSAFSDDANVSDTPDANGHKHADAPISVLPQPSDTSKLSAEKAQPLAMAS